MVINVLLEIKDMSVKINDKLILDNVSKEIDKGEIHIILGPNGSGKSTFAKGILNSSMYQVTGKIYFENKDISDLKTDERARLGIFVSFQTPLEIDGIKNANFVRQSSIANNIKMNPSEFKEKFISALKDSGLSSDFFDRAVNLGFSGGEKKKNELAQLIILNPKFALLDEIDSGMDVDSTKKTAKIISNMAKNGTAFVIITHSLDMIKNLDVNKVYIYKKGKIVKSGDKKLLSHLDSGYLDE